MLTISVKNFGPIAEGSVDLKPLTIFVGPSNTGKSYMATAVYAVMRGFEEIDHESYTYGGQAEGQGKRLYWRGDSGRILTARDEGAAAAAAVLKWAAGLPEEALNGREISVSDMTDDLRAELEDSVRILLGSVASNSAGIIEQNYGEPSDIVRKEANPDDFCVTFRRDEPCLKMAVGLSDVKDSSVGFDLFPFSLRQPFLRSSFDDKNSDRHYPRAALPFLMMVDSVSEPFFAGLPPQSFYLPASRSGMAQTSKVISSSLIRRSSMFGRLPKTSGAALPGIITEFLSNLVSLDRRMNRGNDLHKAVALIETEVLRGKIDLDESGGVPYPEIAYETTEGQFALAQTSSMVSELAPLILFLKYLVRPGDLLILEEPESHLHPAAQRQLARGIVRLVNAGVRVLITTHSDIIISQINNLMALRQASPELVEQGGFEPEDSLQPDQVSAYLFRYNQNLGGCETVPLEIDPDTGIDEDEFAAVFESIYDESIALQRDRN